MDNSGWGDGLDFEEIQPNPNTPILTERNMIPHGEDGHVCYRQCYAWENPEWPESCGDE